MILSKYPLLEALLDEYNQKITFFNFRISSEFFLDVKRERVKGTFFIH